MPSYFGQNFVYGGWLHISLDPISDTIFRNLCSIVEDFLPDTFSGDPRSHSLRSEENVAKTDSVPCRDVERHFQTHVQVEPLTESRVWSSYELREDTYGSMYGGFAYA